MKAKRVKQMKKISFLALLVMLAAGMGTAGAAPASAVKGKSAKVADAKKAEKKKPEKEVEPVREAAPQSPVAISNMATMYYKGQGVKQDYAKALYLYKKAAEQGHMASMITVGAMYEYGQGTRTDYAAAMQWYQKAADKGYASAEKAIGDMYRLGHGVAKNEAAAVQWYKKAADQGFAEALCQLGYMTLRGRGVPADPVKARSLLEEGAQQNNACSQHYLAFMYMSGMITMLPDTGRALELDKLAASNGDAEAQYNIGKANEIGWMEYSTDVEAFSWYENSAVRGYPLAMERLAEVYEKGQLKQKEDPEKAALWRERAKAAWAMWPEPRPASMDSIRFMPLK